MDCYSYTRKGYKIIYHANNEHNYKDTITYRQKFLDDKNSSNLRPLLSRLLSIN